MTKRDRVLSKQVMDAISDRLDRLGKASICRRRDLLLGTYFVTLFIITPPSTFISDSPGRRREPTAFISIEEAENSEFTV